MERGEDKHVYYVDDEPITEEAKEVKKINLKNDYLKNINLKNNVLRKLGLKSIYVYAAIVAVAFALVIAFYPRFNTVTIEAGETVPSIEAFVKNKNNLSKCSAVTDLEKLDTSHVGIQEIILNYGSRKEKAKLIIVDTTNPVVNFKDVSANIDYIPKPEDFISSITDQQETTVAFETVPEIKEFGVMPVNIVVTDKSNNVTCGQANLIISWIKTIYYHEVGDEFSLSNLVFKEEDIQYLDEESMGEFDPMIIGDYNYTCTRNDQIFDCIIHVQDTTAPVLVAKNVETWKDKNESFNVNDFVRSIEDNSGKYTLSMTGTTSTAEVTNHDIIITAKDSSGNISTQTVKFIVKEDTVGPTFSGISTLSVKRGTTPDFSKGVKAIDNVDGEVSFTVDASKVDMTKYTDGNPKKMGYYDVVYTAVDSKGNRTTKTRKVAVLHNEEDARALFMKFYNENLKGKTVTEMCEQLWIKVSHNARDWGGGKTAKRYDIIWYALTNYVGNCFVRTNILLEALKEAGYTAKMICQIDERHYWAIVKQNGTWWHYDATHSNSDLEFGPSSSEHYWEQINKHYQSTIAWDVTKWPELEIDIEDPS